MAGHRRAKLLFGIAWLLAMTLISNWMLQSDDRGSDRMLFAVAFGCGVWIGFPCLCFALIKGCGQLARKEALSMEVVIAACAASTFVVIGITYSVGSRWYLMDQAEAKAFVESQLTAAQRSTAAGGKWPKDQDEFRGGKVLPRLLARQRSPFYSSDRSGQYRIYIHVDFDGGWHSSSERPEWLRST